MPSNAGLRIHQVVARIPRGMVINYTTLLAAADLQRVYFRAIPAYLKTARASGLPAHRVVTSRLSIPENTPEATMALSYELDLKQLDQRQWEPDVLDVLSGNFDPALPNLLKRKR